MSRDEKTKPTKCDHKRTGYRLGNTYCEDCRAWLCAGRLPESVEPSKPSAPPLQDENAWLIESDGLCLGFERNQPKWVAFTNEKALRFARKIDGEHVRKYLISQFPGSKFADEDCSVTEHTWTNQ